MDLLRAFWLSCAEKKTVQVSRSSFEVSLVSYLGTAANFESEVSIHWFLEGRLLRQSGGEVPKGGGSHEIPGARFCMW